MRRFQRPDQRHQLAVEIRVTAGRMEADNLECRRTCHLQRQALNARAKSRFQQDRAVGTMQRSPPDGGVSGVASGTEDREPEQAQMSLDVAR